MKIKAFLLAALLLAGASVAFAQEAESTEAPKDSFITNGFFDNWFIGAAGGLNIAIDSPWNSPLRGIGITLNGNFGKWIDPMWGIRAGLNVGTFKYDNPGTGVTTDGKPLVFLHGDVMWNIVNQFWGYDKARKFQVIPYVTAGLFVGRFAGTAMDFTAGPGILFKYGITERLDLDFDLNLYGIKQNTLDKSANGMALWSNALVGLSYKLGVHDWETKEEALMPATVAAAEAAAALAAVQADNEKLAAEKAEAENAKEEAAKEAEALKDELSGHAAQNDEIVKNLLETPAVVYFEIGQATLSVKELEHFDRIVKTMLSQDENIKFTLTGLTDHNTGSAARNKQLQKQRGNYIHKLLTDKYGLNKDQFEITLDESEQNRFMTIELNRAVIIESAKAAEEAPAEEPAE